MANLWDRLPGESDLAFRAFSEWIACTSSVHDPYIFSQYLKDKAGISVSPESIIDWRRRHAWKKRFGAWIQHVHSRRMDDVATVVSKESVSIAVKQIRGRRLALDKTIKSLHRIGVGNDRDEDVTQGAIRKAIENIGMCVIDHASQLRRLSQTGREEFSSDESEQSEDTD
jgi:hypothetical protein